MESENKKQKRSSERDIAREEEMKAADTPTRSNAEEGDVHHENDANRRTDGREMINVENQEEENPILRFEVGTHVQCRVGCRSTSPEIEWVNGTIVELWYREPDWPPQNRVPYRIRLDDGGRDIFAPVDENDTIRLNPDPPSTSDEEENPPLRFSLGTHVECRVEHHPITGWLSGVVVEQWYRDPEWHRDPERPPLAPYRVALDDGQQVFAPVDVNDIIRLSRRLRHRPRGEEESSTSPALIAALKSTTFGQQSPSPCLHFRAGLGYAGDRLFGGGCLKTNLKTLCAKELVGDYDLLYMSYSSTHYSQDGNILGQTVNHQETLKGTLSLAANQSNDGISLECKFKYDRNKMDVRWNLTCFDSFEWTETNRTDDMICLEYQSIKAFLSIIETPIAIGVLPGYSPSCRISLYEEQDGENVTWDVSEFAYDKSNEFQLHDTAHAISLNEKYYNVEGSWLVHHALLPPELAMIVRTYLYPPPALIFQPGDIWFSGERFLRRVGVDSTIIARPRACK